MRIEDHNLDGTGYKPCEVYDLPSKSDLDFWESVTDVPCPVEGCDHTVVWYEAGYVPGYRVCMEPFAGESGSFRMDTIRHRFLAAGNTVAPKLIRDQRSQ